MEADRIQVDSLVISKLLKGDSDYGQLIGLVTGDKTMVITNCISGESVEMASCLDRLNYESNIVGIYGSLDLKSLVEIQMQKQDETPESIAIWIEQGQLVAFKINSTYLKSNAYSSEPMIERIPISVKDLGLASAFVKNGDCVRNAALTITSIKQSLENLISLSENFQQESWKHQNYYKNIKKVRQAPTTELHLTSELMLQHCQAL